MLLLFFFNKCHLRVNGRATHWITGPSPNRASRAGGGGDENSSGTLVRAGANGSRPHSINAPGTRREQTEREAPFPYYYCAKSVYCFVLLLLDITQMRQFNARSTRDNNWFYAREIIFCASRNKDNKIYFSFNKKKKRCFLRNLQQLRIKTIWSTVGNYSFSIIPLINSLCKIQIMKIPNKIISIIYHHHIYILYCIVNVISSTFHTTAGRKQNALCKREWRLYNARGKRVNGCDLRYTIYIREPKTKRVYTQCRGRWKGEEGALRYSPPPPYSTYKSLKLAHPPSPPAARPPLHQTPRATQLPRRATEATGERDAQRRRLQSDAHFTCPQKNKKK